MPKPEGPPGKNIDHWIEKGWRTLPLSVGATATDEVVFSHDTQSFVVLGIVFGADGYKLKSKDRPHMTVEDTPDGAIITFLEPLKKPIVLLYKIDDDNVKLPA